MNSVSLTGRLTKDPEIRTSGDTTIARFSIAVDRRFKKDGEQSADFLNCVCFGKQADFIEKYFKKGMRIGLNGRIQTGSYTNKEGVRVNTFDIVADTVEFEESKGSGNTSTQSKPVSTQTDGFMNIPDNLDEELPFN